jgi:hypothetical protein
MRASARIGADRSTRKADASVPLSLWERCGSSGHLLDDVLIRIEVNSDFPRVGLAPKLMHCGRPGQYDRATGGVEEGISSGKPPSSLIDPNAAISTRSLNVVKIIP